MKSIKGAGTLRLTLDEIFGPEQRLVSGCVWPFMQDQGQRINGESCVRRPHVHVRGGARGASIPLVKDSIIFCPKSYTVSISVVFRIMRPVFPGVALLQRHDSGTPGPESPSPGPHHCRALQPRSQTRDLHCRPRARVGPLGITAQMVLRAAMLPQVPIPCPNGPFAVLKACCGTTCTCGSSPEIPTQQPLDTRSSGGHRGGPKWRGDITLHPDCIPGSPSTALQTCFP